MKYIIDGHNLISQLTDIELTDPDDEAKLVHKLRSFAARTGAFCLVYFDQGVPAGVSKLSNSKVEVRFASHRTNADQLIIQRMTQEKRPQQVTVVSSDNVVLEEARRNRMKTLKASQFANMLQHPASPEKPGIEESPETHLNDKEVEEWMKLFKRR